MLFNHDDRIDRDKVQMIQYLPTNSCVSFIYDPTAPEEDSSALTSRAAVSIKSALSIAREVMGDDSIEFTRDGLVYTWRRPGT